MVPLSEGRFDLDDYIDYVISILHALGGDTHVVAVCQPSVPVLAAAALMEADDDPYVPVSMVLMGGPIDTRVNPTAVNKLAEKRGIDWFRSHVITKVPFPNPGFMRDVYPGFLQLNGFVSMNLDRHIEAHKQLFLNLVKGDGDSAHKHKEFYDEYLAVMDLAAEFYLQTVDTVFVRHALPKGEMTHRGRPVDLARIKRVALLTVEGEHDDISGVGQTEAAHRLCVNIPPDRRAHYLQLGVGHYGVFNGSRFRSEIAPRISDFVLSMGQSSRTARNGAAIRRVGQRRRAAYGLGFRSFRVRISPAASPLWQYSPRMGFGTRRHAAACAALSPPERASDDRDRLRRIGLSGAGAAAPAGAALYAAHPGGDTRSHPHHSAARHAEGSARLSRRSMAAGSRRGSDGCRKRRRSPTASSCRCAACRTASRIAAAARGTVWTETAGNGERLLCVAGHAPHIDRRIGDFLRREAKRELEAASLRFARALGVAIKRV